MFNGRIMVFLHIFSPSCPSGMGVRRMIDVHLTWWYRAALTYWTVGVFLWNHTQRQVHIQVMYLCVLSHTYIVLGTAHPGSLACVSVLDSRQFCAWRKCNTCPLCGLKEAKVNTERVVETSRRRVLVEVRLENKGENAYNTQLYISHSANLHFSSLMVKVCLHTHIHIQRFWAV